VINPPQQRGAPTKIGVIFGTVDSVGSSGIDVGRHSSLFHIGIMPPEPANNLAAAERLVQLADALLEHGPYRHDHIVRGLMAGRIIEQTDPFPALRRATLAQLPRA
jgi:hypothetical protein